MRSDRIAGIVSIDEGLEKAGAVDVIIPLTYHDGRVDLIYAGAPECSYCQEFMKTGFGDLVDFAHRNDYDMAYMPMATSGLGLAIAAVEKCALPSATIPPAEIVRIAYGSVEVISTAAREANIMIKNGQTADEVDRVLSDVMASLHGKLSPATDFDAACYGEVSATIGEQMGSFSDTFGLTGTPSFYYARPDGSVMRIVGSPDIVALDGAMK